MIRVAATGFITACVLAGCARHPFDVTDTQGALLFSASKGGCFVGCNLNVRNSDGTLCRGHVASIQEGYPVNGGISCAGRAPQTLSIKKWKRGESVTGTLDGKPVIATFK